MDLFCVGEIVKTRGLDGEIKVSPYSANIKNLASLKTVIIEGKTYNVLRASAAGGMVFYKLEGVDLEAAQALRGKKIHILREQAAPLKPGQYYIKDLLGCMVFADEQFIGEISAVDNYGSADVITVVNRAEGKTVRFPMLKRIIKNIDIDNKRADLDAKGFSEVSIYED